MKKILNSTRTLQSSFKMGSFSLVFCPGYKNSFMSPYRKSPLLENNSNILTGEWTNLLFPLQLSLPYKTKNENTDSSNWTHKQQNTGLNITFREGTHRKRRNILQPGGNSWDFEKIQWKTNQMYIKWQYLPQVFFFFWPPHL